MAPVTVTRKHARTRHRWTTALMSQARSRSPDREDRLVGSGMSGTSGETSPSASSSWPIEASSSRVGLSRRSSKCRGMTLANALSIEPDVGCSATIHDQAFDSLALQAEIAARRAAAANDRQRALSSKARARFGHARVDE